DIDTNHVATPLVDDGVDGDRGLARLAVADDQLTLSAADRNHGVDGFDSGLQRFLHGQALDHTGREPLNRVEALRVDGAFAVDGLAERVHYPPDHLVAHWDRHNTPCAPDFVTLLDFRVIAEQHRSNLVLFEVHGDAGNVVWELDQLARHHLFQA